MASNLVYLTQQYTTVHLQLRLGRYNTHAQIRSYPPLYIQLNGFSHISIHQLKSRGSLKIYIEQYIEHVCSIRPIKSQHNST